MGHSPLTVCVNVCVNDCLCVDWEMVNRLQRPLPPWPCKGRGGRWWLDEWTGGFVPVTNFRDSSHSCRVFFWSIDRLWRHSHSSVVIAVDSTEVNCSELLREDERNEKPFSLRRSSLASLPREGSKGKLHMGQRGRSKLHDARSFTKIRLLNTPAGQPSPPWSAVPYGTIGKVYHSGPLQTGVRGEACHVTCTNTSLLGAATLTAHDRGLFRW